MGTRRTPGAGRRLWAAAMALAMAAALTSPLFPGVFQSSAEASGLTRTRRISEETDPVTEEEQEEAEWREFWEDDDGWTESFREDEDEDEETESGTASGETGDGSGEDSGETAGAAVNADDSGENDSGSGSGSGTGTSSQSTGTGNGIVSQSAGQREARVFDDAGLFSDAEEAALQARIVSIREKWQIDPVIVTSYAVPDNRSSSSEEKTMAWADDYYDQGGFGLGEDKAGFLYLIDMNNRVSYISTGGVMIDYVSDRRKERLLSNADEFLGEGEYGKAAMAVLQSAEKMMQDGIEEGHFRYDEVTGKRLTGLYNRLTRGEIILAAACGLGAAGLLGGIVGARYGLAIETYKFNKLTQSKVKLSRNDKTFLRQTVTRTRIPQNSGGGRGGGHGGGGSGVHISSGGVSHGGGGHHF